MSKELYQDYINGLSISELANKYKISKTRVYKDIAEYSKKQDKVLSIIKEKCVSIWYLMKSKTVEEYNSYLYIEDIDDTKTFILTEEEFDLVKEMMK